MVLAPFDGVSKLGIESMGGPDGIGPITPQFGEVLTEL
jgi:hypothetical protein